MKILLISLQFIAVLWTSSSFAYNYQDMPIELGMDYKAKATIFDSNHGFMSFHNASSEYSPTIRLKPFDSTSFLLGYDISTDKYNRYRTFPGDYHLGIYHTFSDPWMDYDSKYTLSGPFIELTQHLPIDDSWELIATCGLGYKSFKAITKLVVVDDVLLSPESQEEHSRKFKATAMTYRLSFGIGYEISPNFGIRTVLGYEDLGQFKTITPAGRPQSFSVKLKAAAHALVSLYYKF